VKFFIKVLKLQLVSLSEQLSCRETAVAGVLPFWVDIGGCFYD